MKANLQKASRWAKIREEYIAEARRCENAAYQAGGGRLKRVRMKSRAGRGRKTSPWVEALYPELFTEFFDSRSLE
jgi:hypothetical protein